MQLEESQTSSINDVKLLKQIEDASKGRPAWVGGYRPECPGEGYEGYVKWARAHYLFYLNFVKEFMEPGGRVLDLGCGNGQNTAMLARYAREVVGIDPEPEFALKYNTAPNIVYVKGTFPENIAPEEGFDAIFCVEVIEHIHYDKQERVIDAALGLLHPTGHLFLTTPNEQSAGGNHCGIWVKDVADRLFSKYAPNIVKRGYFSNTRPEVGMLTEGASHYALVMKS